MTQHGERMGKREPCCSSRALAALDDRAGNSRYQVQARATAARCWSRQMQPRRSWGGAGLVVSPRGTLESASTATPTALSGAREAGATTAGHCAKARPADPRNTELAARPGY